MRESGLPDWVQVQREDFSVAEHYQRLHQAAGSAGAVVFFVGQVRAESETDPVLALELEHYPAMTERAIAKIVEEAQSRWSLAGALVIHRYGRLETGAQIMMVATASRHRVDAFQAAEFLMDYLKSRAPFWKKELTKDGESWVEARDEDENALGRW